MVMVVVLIQKFQEHFLPQVNSDFYKPRSCVKNVSYDPIEQNLYFQIKDNNIEKVFQILVWSELGQGHLIAE